MIDFKIPAEQIIEGRSRVNAKFLAETLFVVPKNDGEAVRAVEVLEALGAPHLRVSKQAWGATLEREGLPAKLPDGVKRVVVFEIPSIHEEKALREKGLEVVIIDHHFYKDVDRRRDDSSLEQLAAMLNWPMSKVDMAIAVNDRGYIPGMIAMGLSKQEIRDVRLYDTVAQGRTPDWVADMIRISQEDIPTFKVEAGVTIIDRPIADEGILKQELALRTVDGIAHSLIINSGRVSFSGDPRVVKSLLETNFENLGYAPGSYSQYGGGDAKASMFFGFNPKTAPQNAKELIPLGIQRRIREIVRQARLEGGHQ
ncbi:MAG: hypothetical protein V4760_05695 [Bdellovibrionota bacterium]